MGEGGEAGAVAKMLVLKRWCEWEGAWADRNCLFGRKSWGSSKVSVVIEVLRCTKSLIETEARLKIPPMDFLPLPLLFEV